ncbi:MAG: glutamate mutase L, partial [Planctomycetota bacterium]
MLRSPGMDRLLIADVGSTTTKAVLFRKDRGWTFDRSEAPTTVEAPHEDVAIGLRAALRQLGDVTGETLLDGDAPALPLHLTSSAGGGLAMVVTGLVKRVTSLSAERAALGAGAILLDTIALDDGRVPYKKLAALKSLRPDILLFAGGFDGDALSGPVFLAEIVRQADLRPKLSPEARLPVVYAGNVNARSLVRETLGDRYVFRPVPNLRPESDRENLEPARNEIHALFKEHVMSHAPGYRGIAEGVSTSILPTPSAVSRLLETVTAGSDERVLVVDVGGATTDVYTARRGKVFRTVSANLGMSYSLLNVVDTAGLSAIHELLDFAIDEAELLDRLGNKYLDPTRLPDSAADLTIEWAAAAVAVRHAVIEHLAVMHGAPLSLGEDDLAIRSMMEKRKRVEVSEGTLVLRGYDLVVGSGGILSHSPREAAAMILTAALSPVGAVDLAVDRAFLFPHLGVLTQTDATLAGELYHLLGLTRLGTLLASAEGEVEARGARADGSEIAGRAGSGELARIRLEPGETADLSVRGISRRRVTARGGSLGILLDARGRPPADPRTTFVPEPVELPPPRPSIEEEPRLESGTVRERRELAVPGRVLVEAGERVRPDSLVARCVQAFPRPFFLRPAEALGVEPGEVTSHLLVGVGEEIES